MSYVVKQERVMNQTIKIVQDDSADSPREWDNLAKMIFVGNRKHLGDKHNVDFDIFGGFSSREDFIENGEKIVRQHFKDVVICYPIHLYSHSGESISVNYSGQYACRWDSGTIGFAIVTKKDIRDNWNVKNVTKKYIEHADRILIGEVEELNKYIMGEVYGYIIEDENGEHIDSCYGFYGDDIKTNGIAEHIGEEFVKALEG
jgi:hypothetical protein